MKHEKYHQLLNELYKKYKDEPTDKERKFLCFRDMVHLFHERNGRYPVATEFTHENLLPLAKTLERMFGGIRKFREDIGLDITDYTKGETRANKVKKIMANAMQYEDKLFKLLYEKYNDPRAGVVVQREPVISEFDPENGIHGYRRTDVAINVFSDNGRVSTYIDFFYASTPHTMYGCLNIKKKKIAGLLDLEQVVFVSINPKMTKDIIATSTIPPGCPRVLSYEEFMDEYINSSILPGLVV